MRRLSVFNNVSLDGYFVDAHGDMSWAHNASKNKEWDQFVASNASGGAALVFGRITYELMVRYWPTPMARQNDPVVAERMNSLPKVVFSRTLAGAEWNNTRLVRDGLADEIRRMKAEAPNDMVILGSGSLVSQLTQARLIDEYQMVVIPVVLGGGRTLFEGLREKLSLTLTRSRSFGNGNVVLWYEPIA